jgi:hypothetical protein
VARDAAREWRILALARSVPEGFVTTYALIESLEPPNEHRFLGGRARTHRGRRVRAARAAGRAGSAGALAVRSLNLEHAAAGGRRVLRSAR